VGTEDQEAELEYWSAPNASRRRSRRLPMGELRHTGFDHWTMFASYQELIVFSFGPHV
jgi:hypothetical protein